jgi:hypothetical protein
MNVLTATSNWGILPPQAKHEPYNSAARTPSWYQQATVNHCNGHLVSGSVAKPNKAVGDKTEPKNLNRNFNATSLLVKSCLCL